MKIKTFSLGPIQANCHIYYDEETMECVAIDPGDADDIGKVIYFLEEEGLHLKGVLLTHGHYDHIGGCKELIAPIYAGVKENELLFDGKLNLSSFSNLGNLNIVPDKLLSNGDIINISKNASLEILETPGHTEGSVCFYDKENGVLFSGDTLFYKSVGRTDLPTGDQMKLIDSIRQKLFVLPNETVVYPGHEINTTIGFEKENNLYVK